MKRFLVTLTLIGLVAFAGCGSTYAGTANGTNPTQTAVPTTTTPMVDETAAPEDNTGLTEEQARQQAHDFVTNSPTFLFDGMTDTVELVDVTILKCVGCFTFSYEFDCLHGGYGDRTGKMVTQAITHHQAVIDFRRGNLTSAVLDGTWDMQVQMVISTEEESRELAREYLENSPTFLYDGIVGSITFKETLETFGFYTWGFVFEFDSDNAGYGDRSGKIVATVTTHHTAVISVSGGRVANGVIDGKWDMQSQLVIPPTLPRTTTATAP